MTTMTKRIVGMMALVASASAGYAAGTQSGSGLPALNPAALKFLLPQDIKWGPAEGLTGTDTSVLVGDPAKPGLYVVLNRFHAGNFSRPHYHPNPRYIMVISGTWWVGTGATFDPERATVPMKPGTFVTHTAREVHYDGARTGSDDAVVMIFGEGPGTRQECEGATAEKGPGPCETARKAGTAGR